MNDKTKSFDERFDEFFYEAGMWIEPTEKEVKQFFRQEILKVIDSFEMEGKFRDIEPSENLHEYQLRRSGYNKSAREINSRVKELRKEYE